ncbi:sugar ABC transporter ATP-binding protein [Schaalia sp. ZJ405]|uniref:sugar ABC transporter ATP-binding protein n=1 Tax=Schaalia sp. ZJ405 TaxID=2709403 RepID=UPI0013EA2267|nr:sugar ABC transporter ATP-binding protein [Schaalia sp. ZJ405]QPK80940.1 sugar ABC transporter ATP-binding protein [Schaalia sp. ZJ405]
MDIEEILRIENLNQIYPGVHAVKDVSMSVKRGTILGLVGENGAGKSTLIKMLGGIEKPQSGRILVRGTTQTFTSSSEAQASGIAVVSQEFRLVPDMSVADNIFLGHELKKGVILNRAESAERAKMLLDTLGLDLDPSRSVSSLTIADQQLVEIARALSLDFSLIILDEPSATLNEAETKNLHRIIQNIAESGRAAIYVSHHLKEILKISTDIVVMRDGRKVLEASSQTQNEDSIVLAMLGRMPAQFQKEDRLRKNASVILEVNEIEIAGNPHRHSFTLHRGEILGLAGLVGSGRAELSKCLSGVLPVLNGEIIINNQVVQLTGPRSAIQNGIFTLSEDRKAEGILPHLSVLENALIAKEKKNLSRLNQIIPIPRLEKQAFQELRVSMNIKVANDAQRISSLSGGNQQKVLLGRSLVSGCPVLVLNEPTRGVDVGAKVEIYQLIKSLSQIGVSIIISSSDASELATICNRCLVYFAGEKFIELSGAELNEDSIVSAAVGRDLRKEC